MCPGQVREGEEVQVRSEGGGAWAGLEGQGCGPASASYWGGVGYSEHGSDCTVTQLLTGHRHSGGAVSAD